MRTATNQRIYNSALIPQHSVLVVALCAMLFGLCASAEAQQQKKIPRIGYLAGVAPATNTYRIDAFREGLLQLGYAERKDFVIEYRYAGGKVDRLNELAAELVRLKVDVIVTRGPTATGAAKAATATINAALSGKRLEILKETIPQLSRVGVLWNPKNLARPGGNITGFSTIIRPAMER